MFYSHNWLSLWPILLLCYQGQAAHECRSQSCRLMLLQQRKATGEDNETSEGMLGELLREHGKVYNQFMNDSMAEATSASEAGEDEASSGDLANQTC
eukprot:g24001.t1